MVVTVWGPDLAGQEAPAGGAGAAAGYEGRAWAAMAAAAGRGAVLTLDRSQPATVPCNYCNADGAQPYVSRPAWVRVGWGAAVDAASSIHGSRTASRPGAGAASRNTSWLW